jgi:hypothetical protein
MPLTSLCFVLADRVTDFDAMCRAAGFDGERARRVRAVYSGLTCSERRMARTVATRLWLPVSLEPMLTGSSYGLDDEAPSDENDAPRASARHAAGAAALDLALRERGAHIAIVMKAALAERIASDLAALLPDHVVRLTSTDAAAFEIGLDLADRAAHSVAAARATPGWSVPTLDAIGAYLTELGADRVAHPGGTLLGHLRRTADLLARWNSRPALVLAGFCHAAYGTDGFQRALLDVRERCALAARIGLEAEAIVYAYAACDRVAGYPSLTRRDLHDRFCGQVVPIGEPMARDLAALACANELDVLRFAPSLAGSEHTAIGNLLQNLRPMLDHRAALAVGEALSPRSWILD